MIKQILDNKLIKYFLCLCCCVFCFTTVYAEEMSPGDCYYDYYVTYDKFNHGEYGIPKYVSDLNRWFFSLGGFGPQKLIEVFPNGDSITLYFSLPNDLIKDVSSYSFYKTGIYIYDSDSVLLDYNFFSPYSHNFYNTDILEDWNSEKHLLSVTYTNANMSVYFEKIKYVSFSLPDTFVTDNLQNGVWVSGFNLYDKSCPGSESDPPPTEPDSPDNPDKPSIDESNLVSSFYTLFIDRLSFISTTALESPVFLGFVGVFLIFIILEIFLFLFNKGGYK